ncbi:MAG: alpha/beta hydrolase-fold protein [Pseudomonadota bacterium]
MTFSIESLLTVARDNPDALGSALAARSIPMVDGNKVTFVFHGQADAVYLRCWVSGLDTSQPLEPLEAGELWATTIDLPTGSRVEYKLEVVRNGQSELILDPLNPNQADDPFGANSVCQADGYERPEWTERHAETHQGSLHIVQVPTAAFGGTREVQVYLPSTFRDNRRYPLLIVHDGIDYLRYADFQNVLDNLIHRLEIPPMVVALTQSPDRLSEYAGNDRHAAFIAEDLLGFMQQAFPLDDRPDKRCLMGASFGGVASLHAAWRYPELFGNLLLQSGSFAFSDLGRHKRGPVFDPVVEFMNEFRADTVRPAERVFISCGMYESLIYENRSLVPHLQQKDVDVRFEEARDAHNWQNWRDRLRLGLSWLYPGPAWIVYE